MADKKAQDKGAKGGAKGAAKAGGGGAGKAPVVEKKAERTKPVGGVAKPLASAGVSRLQRRVCRPLDKPLIARKDVAEVDINDYDEAIDAEPESDFGDLSDIITTKL